MAASWTMSAHAGSTSHRGRRPPRPVRAPNAESGTRRPVTLIRMGSSVGLFGGSFNPVHKRARPGSAVAAVDELRLANILVMPAAASPHQTAAPGFDRTTPPRPGADRIRPASPSDGFRTGDRACGPSYTIDTVRELLRTTDADRSRSSWARTRLRASPLARAKALVRLCDIAAFDRGRNPEEQIVSARRRLPEAKILRLTAKPTVVSHRSAGAHSNVACHWRARARRRRRRHRRGRTRRVQARRSSSTALDRARQIGAPGLRPAHRAEVTHGPAPRASSDDRQ